MPGYGGKSMAGFLLGTLAILSSAKVGTAILVLGVPVMDAIYVIISRILSRRNPVWSHRDHLHHRLLDAGWSKQRIALFYWAVSAILGIVALLVNARQKFFAVLATAIIVLMFISWLKLYTSFSKKPDRDSG